MNKKVLFFDIDGTLVGKNKKMSAKTIEAIQRLRNNGHYAILCTGRSCNYIDCILQHGFDGHISCAGAYIVFNDKVISENYLDQNLIKKVSESFDRHGIAYDHEVVGTDYLKDEMIEWMFDDKNPEIKKAKIDQFKNENKTSPMVNYKNEPVLKMSYVSPSMEQLIQAKKDFEDDFKIAVNPTFSKNSVVGDLMLNNVDKGTAILKLIDYLGFDIKDTIGFGDSMNDIEMFKVCAESVVMGNGSDEIKKYATTICEDVENDGIYYELERRSLI